MCAPLCVTLTAQCSFYAKTRVLARRGRRFDVAVARNNLFVVIRFVHRRVCISDAAETVKRLSGICRRRSAQDEFASDKHLRGPARINPYTVRPRG